MDKQIIEEMANDIKASLGLHIGKTILYPYIAQDLCACGYRKIPENAVVLTREAYNKLEKKIADLSYDADFHKQQEERIVDLQYDKFELKQEISEKDNKIALLEETIECIKFNVDFTRKETAEKFAVRLKASKTIKAIFGEGWIFSYVEVCKEIDEIAKEMEAIYAKYD